jgi:hypothetical protein
VARHAIVDLLDGHIDAAERRLSGLMTAFHEGRVSPGTWVAVTRTELQRLHLQNAALGAGGWDRLRATDYGRIGGALQADYRRLLGFAEDVRAGKLTLAQAQARMALYAGNARREFYHAERDRIRPSAAGRVVIERRRLNSRESCEDCVGYYQQGWEPVGVLPVPGEGSKCLTNCRCNLEQREVSLTEVNEWIGTKR